MNAPFHVRPATLYDIPTLVAYRRAMFESMGVQDEAAMARMCEATGRYLNLALPAGDYLGWVAEAGGQVIASGGMVIHLLPPGPRNMDGREGYILNIYTLPEWRQRGVATEIVNVILAYLRDLGVPVATLHASAAGKPLYETLGFTTTNEMRLIMNGTGLDCLSH